MIPASGAGLFLCLEAAGIKTGAMLLRETSYARLWPE